MGHGGAAFRAGGCAEGIRWGSQEGKAGCRCRHVGILGRAMDVAAILYDVREVSASEDCLWRRRVLAMCNIGCLVCGGFVRSVCYFATC